MYRRQSKKHQTNQNSNKSDNKTRRSSLHVNLSYTFDLSDSENTDGSPHTVDKNHDNKKTQNTSTINDDISRVLANISDKDEALSRNCARLRDAILNKTKELFDKQNEFCQMTTKVMESQSMPSDDQCKLNHGSPILRSCRNYNINKLSPRKTRSSTMRERLNSFAASNSHTTINDSVNEMTNIGSPIVCSTFTEKYRDDGQSCNVKKIIDNSVKSLNTPEPSVPKFEVKVIHETTPLMNKGRPSVINIQTCNIKLDKIDGFKQVNKSKTLQEVSMDLTNVQGNCILNESSKQSKRLQENEQIKICPPTNGVITSEAGSTSTNLSNLIEDITSSDCLKQNYSMHVNTSLDKLFNYDDKLNSRTCQNTETKPDSTNAIVNNVPTVDLSTDCDNFEDDVSLMQRLRNISQKSSQEERVTVIQKKNDKSPGVVEGTPLPITRSMVLRTQAKLNSLDENTKSQHSNVPEFKRHPTKSNSGINRVELEKTIVLDSTPFRLNKYGNQAPIIIQESSDDELSEITEADNDVNTQNTTKQLISKKKLFTQHDNSGPASLSPLSNDVCSPQIAKLKRLKRRRIMRNVAGRIINTQPTLGISQRHPLAQIVVTSSTSSQDSEKIRDFKKSRKKKRAVKSKKIVVKKQLKPNLLKDINRIRDRSFDADPQTSRSSNVFMTKKRIPTKRNYGNQRIIIVSTGLCNGDKDIVKDAVKSLSGATMESSVTRKTTHIVTSGVRTVNLLRGIIRGCWLVKFDWIKKSIKAGKWLPAEKYEIDHFSKAVAENRRDREIFGSSYVPDLFATCGLIHVQNNTTPPPEILKELIKTAGGLIIEEQKKSKIIIGREGIKENWVLDSITTGELQSIESYKRHK